MSKPVSAWLKILISGLGIILLSQVTSIYLPIILAVIAAFLLNPLVSFLSKPHSWSGRFILPRSLAVLATFLLAGCLLLLVLTFLFLPFIKEFNRFVVDLPTLGLKIQNISTVIEKHTNSMMHLPENVKGLTEQALSAATTYSVGLLRRIFDSILHFASQIVQLLVVPVLTYYFLKDWQSLKDHFVAVFPANLQNKLRLMIEEMGVVVSGYIRGQILTSIVIGFIVFLGMYLMDVNYPLVLGLLAMLTETIPIIGPIIGSVPAILLAYLVSPALALKVIVFYLIVHQVENHIVLPNIMGHTIELHPVLIIISLLVGGQFFGIIGMMLAVPVMALLRVIIRHLWYFGESR
ncbi:Hypothetical protein LUCI_1249 [Lucifera butyrica]|uniref:AI-2E family transporter n=1 Tax=Lucifera butyrica TaxID=1351585 RepID=A0A498RA58_9FIRM|nr:AI-2E family transporter [Lucifera butyrica]VBB06038.1 Hypothetical protein LUCI_1249 [Lucifera butyrica]